MRRACIAATLSALAAITIGCPDGDGPASTTGTTGETTTLAVTTAEESTSLATSTGEASSTGMTDVEPTTSAPISCGDPAPECINMHREWCEDFADICKTAGLSPSGAGTDYCATLGDLCSTDMPCQACFSIANTCKQLGKGAEVCDDVFADCLCRAAALGLDING